jgi:hypothetical protein
LAALDQNYIDLLRRRDVKAWCQRQLPFGERVNADSGGIRGLSVSVAHRQQ